MSYRFRQTEIEKMKQSIVRCCEHEDVADEHGNKSAWRLRVALEGLAMCCRCSKREKALRYREIALYKMLTVNDMPNF